MILISQVYGRAVLQSHKIQLPAGLRRFHLPDSQTPNQALTAAAALAMARTAKRQKAGKFPSSNAFPGAEKASSRTSKLRHSACSNSQTLACCYKQHSLPHTLCVSSHIFHLALQQRDNASSFPDVDVWVRTLTLQLSVRRRPLSARDVCEHV